MRLLNDTGKFPALAILFLFLIVYLFPLGSRPMVPPDEFRYAEIPREMLVSGNWTAPKLLDIRYFEKPGLGYQMTAASFKIFGENRFALRLPSALAAGFAAIGLWLLLAKRGPTPLLSSLAPFGTALFLTCGIVYGVGTFAVIDMQLTAAITLTLIAFYFAWSAPTKTRTVLLLALAGFFAGIAFLLKGFLAFAIPVIVVVPFLLWQKEWKKILWMPWIPLLSAVLTALPWSVAIHQAEPDFWNYFINVEHLDRFTTSTGDRNPEPFWYFIPVLLGGMLPAGLLVVVAWLGWTRQLFRSPLVRFCLCWFAMPFLFFSTSSCKLGTYILPCFPPLAALLAFGVLEAFRSKEEKTRKLLHYFIKSLGILLLTCFVLAIPGLPVFFHIVKLPIPPMAFIAMLIVLLLGLMLFRYDRLPFPQHRWYLILLTFALLIPVGLKSYPEELFGAKMPSYGIQECARVLELTPDDVLYVDSPCMHSVAWELKRSDMILYGNCGELQYGFDRYPEEYDARNVSWREMQEGFWKTYPVPRGKSVMILMRGLDRLPLPMQFGFPEPITVVEFGGITGIRF